MQLDQFTEFNNDTIPFPLTHKTDSCKYYCETMGFNTVQASRAFTTHQGLRLTFGLFAGIANDGLTEFLQNDYSHGRNGISPVPREGERKGMVWGGSSEINREVFAESFFTGVGLLFNNVYQEAYLHSGLLPKRLSFFNSEFGIQYGTTFRLGVIQNSREYLFKGKPFFRKLSPLVGMGQIEIGLYGCLFKIPLGFSWRGGYSTGVFMNQDTERAEGMWLEGLKTTIWKFTFERYNDALNQTDYGPTYGVKMNFIPFL